jgi:hypothetical protein
MRHRSSHLLLLVAAIAIAGGCKSKTAADTETKSIVDQHLAVVPSSAKQVAEGRAAIKYTAKRSGLVYLYDLTANVLLDAQRINKGQTYRVSTDRDAVWIDDRQTNVRGLYGQHLLRVYIDPS